MKHKKETTMGTYVSAAVAATSIVALCSLVASGTAVSTVVSGFKAAKKAAADILNGEDQAEACERCESAEIEIVEELELTQAGEDAQGSTTDTEEE